MKAFLVLCYYQALRSYLRFSTFLLAICVFFLEPTTKAEERHVNLRKSNFLPRLLTTGS
jgi:hypothetical protein